MAINALNSGARVWLADLEDANTPHWRNVVGGQVNLHDAVRRTIAFTSPEGKEYAAARPASTAGDRAAPPRLALRRGSTSPSTAGPWSARWSTSACYFFHNAHELLDARQRPLLLPAEDGVAPRGAAVERRLHPRRGARSGSRTARSARRSSSRPSPAAFEMDEILYELRDHAAGLNAGRWDYLFSIIKYFRDAGPAFTLPDRNAVTMTAPMMRAYSDLLVQTCHRRGAFAIGGMAAFIPSRRDPEVNERAFAKVREDKTREAARRLRRLVGGPPRPGAVCCEEIFDGVLGDRPNQLDGSATTSRSRPTTCSPSPRRPAGAPRRACAATSRSASPTSRPGWRATAPRRSTTSWRTPPRPRSPAPRCGSGLTTRPRSTPAR